MEIFGRVIDEAAAFHVLDQDLKCRILSALRWGERPEDLIRVALNRVKKHGAHDLGEGMVMAPEAEAIVLEHAVSVEIEGRDASAGITSDPGTHTTH